MNSLSWSFRIITYLLTVLLFNLTVVLISWPLQIAGILLNFSFNFKYLLNACHISYTVLTTFTCMFIFKGLIFFFPLLVLTSNVFDIPSLIIATIFAASLFLFQHHVVTWNYLGLDIVSLKLPSCCFVL